MATKKEMLKSTREILPGPPEERDSEMVGPINPCTATVSSPQSRVPTDIPTALCPINLPAPTGHTRNKGFQITRVRKKSAHPFATGLEINGSHFNSDGYLTFD